MKKNIAAMVDELVCLKRQKKEIDSKIRAIKKQIDPSSFPNNPVGRPKGNMEEKILDILHKNGKPVKGSELASNFKGSYFNTLIFKMVKNGVVKRASRGYYALPDVKNVKQKTGKINDFSLID